MKPTVFISSTYNDLKLHRNQVWRVIKAFDINIRGMEEFGAKKETPLETCLREVEKSDIYIGIISMRYGSIDNSSGKSYTQLEYERALEKNLDILIYLIDEDNGIVKTGNIDFSYKQEKLQAFKLELRRHTVDVFINEVDLAQKIQKKLLEKCSLKSDSNFRPVELDALVEIFHIDNVEFIMILGFNNGSPFEMFIFEYSDDGFFLPKSIGNGKIIKTINEKGVDRYDFRFLNIHGYKVTVEGINLRYNNKSNWLYKYSVILTELFQQNIGISGVVRIVERLEIRNRNIKNWSENIINIIEKHTRNFT